MTQHHEAHRGQESPSRLMDIVSLAMMIVPFLACMTLKVLTTPASEGINVTGARIFFTIPLPLGGMPVTESQTNTLAVMICILGLCLFLTNGLTVRKPTKRQIVAEWIVKWVQNFVDSSMGSRFSAFAPFVAAIMALSALSSLSTLVGLYPPTSDINIVAGWAILVFVLITYYKLKGGIGPYIKGYFEPIPFFAPFNVISEIATPVSMAFRHYGNVLSGLVISTLLGYALQNLSHLVLGWLPGFLGEFPFLQIGIPAILSFYFDLFSGCLQAFIFAMLTMLYISSGFDEEAYERRQAKRKALRA